MSINSFLSCHDCRKILLVGCRTSTSGFRLYSDEPMCMQALSNFLADHTRHRLEMVGESSCEADYYEPVEWPSSPERTT